MQFYSVEDFVEWRSTSRRLLSEGRHHRNVHFKDANAQNTLFGVADDGAAHSLSSSSNAHVPKEFLQLAETVAYHRNESRWNVLYRVLWRLTHGESALLKISTDDDVLALRGMEKEVRRDSHKMKAFVRFRKVILNETEYFIAWHRPDHLILRNVAPFFSRRFKGMNWTILTPDESVSWDQKELRYGDGVARSEAPKNDELEDLWRTYYASIFNPARIKIKMMKSEMPVRHWATLPEAEIIDDLLRDAPRRVKKMIENQEGFATTAADVIRTSGATSLLELAEAAAGCQACDLYKHTTQTVFGVGPSNAKLVIVGEQPGDKEDLEGKPFVGPAGQVLHEALKELGINRDEVYVTNVVKHFSFRLTEKSERRWHRTPTAREVRCCKPWFDAEWAMLFDAEVLLCLGGTAATALISPEFKISRQRGEFFTTSHCTKTIASWHPSAILRTPDPKLRELKRQQLISDLRLAWETVVCGS